MKKIRHLIQKMTGKRSSASQQLLSDLRKSGAVIGEDVVIYDPQNTLIDQTAPWLLTIGDHVRITSGVKILTHDYAWSVLKRRDGSILGAQGPVVIGSNVFIGVNAVITRGVSVGDNVVIGAGSVVTKDCPSGGVYAGNPARRIMSIDAFCEKRRACQFEEAKTLARQYQARFGVMPPKEIFAEYFLLFADVEEAKKNPAFCKKMELLENYDQTERYMVQNQRMFAGYEAFLQACFQDEDI